MLIKKGVIIKGLEWQIIVILPILECMFMMVSSALVITSALEGVHKKDSLHSKGLAIDIRLPFKSKYFNECVVSEIKLNIGKDYDVILEVDHIHIEFDPK